MAILIAAFGALIALPVCLIFMPTIKDQTVGTLTGTVMAGTPLDAFINILYLTWPAWIIGAGVFVIIMAIKGNG